MAAGKRILRQVKSYLSPANVETPLDAWCAIVEEGGGNKVTERQGLIDLTGEVDDSSVAASKAFANQELMVIEYI